MLAHKYVSNIAEHCYWSLPTWREDLESYELDDNARLADGFPGMSAGSSG